MKVTQVFIVLGMCVLVAFLSSCQSTHQMNKVQASGFIKNVNQLKPGASGEAVLRYINPTIDFSKYDRIMIDPVVIYARDGSSLAKLSNKQQQALADYFSATLRKEISDVYPLTARSGAKTLRLRTAITEAKASKPLRDLTSNIVPFSLAASVLKRRIGGTHSAVGRVQVEMEVVDSVTGKQLAAAIDARAGNKQLRGKLDRWDDVKNAFDFWAKRIRDRLAKPAGSEPKLSH